MLRLTHRNARIIFSGDDKHRLLDFLDVVHRCNLFQIFAHFRIALVAILDAPQIAPVRFGMLQKRHEIRHPDDVHGAADAVAVERRNSQRHMPAVTSTRDRNALRVEFRLRGDPVEKRVDVFIGVFTLEPVIQQRESLSVACRAAHVRINQRDSQFVQQIIVAPQKSRLRLAFRAAVNDNQHWPFAGELCEWLI